MSLEKPAVAMQKSTLALAKPAVQGITLYSHADDIRSHWIRLVLAEKNINYQLILVDHDDEDLSSLNPYNQLPTLVDQELKLYQCGIIAEYLDDRYRQNKLYADAPVARAEQRQYIWRFERDWFRLAEHIFKHPDSLDPHAKLQAQKELRDSLVSLTPLFQHYPFFMSESFTILDCMLAPMFLRLEHMGVVLPTQHCRPIRLYCQRIFARPAFVKSLTEQEQRGYKKAID